MNVLPPRKATRNFFGVKPAYVRQAIAFLIVVTLLNLSVPLLPKVLAAGGGNASGATGIIRVSGVVTIDELKATSGQTIFPGSQIQTSEDSEALVDLGKFTRLRLLGETKFGLDFSKTSIVSTLTSGVLRGFIPAGTAVNIKTAAGELITDASQPTEFTVQVIGDTTRVSVEAGRVELRKENELKTVSAGEVFTTAPVPQTQPDPDEGMTTGQKIGLVAAIGAAATILALVLIGRDEEAPQFGGCVIVPSGESPSVCP